MPQSGWWMPTIELHARVLQAGTHKIPLTGDTALASTQPTHHGNPADRFIAAGAISRAATLVSNDETLQAWKHAHKRRLE